VILFRLYHVLTSDEGLAWMLGVLTGLIAAMLWLQT